MGWEYSHNSIYKTRDCRTPIVLQNEERRPNHVNWSSLSETLRTGIQFDIHWNSHQSSTISSDHSNFFCIFSRFSHQLITVYSIPHAQIFSIGTKPSVMIISHHLTDSQIQQSHSELRVFVTSGLAGTKVADFCNELSAENSMQWNFHSVDVFDLVDQLWYKFRLILRSYHRWDDRGRNDSQNSGFFNHYSQSFEYRHNI
jgi:hypothetical protein